MLPSYKSCFQVYKLVSKSLETHLKYSKIFTVTKNCRQHHCCHFCHQQSPSNLVALQFIYAQKCFKDDSTNLKITLSLSLLFVHAKKHNQTQRFQSFLEGIFSTKFRENFKKFGLCVVGKISI